MEMLIVSEGKQSDTRRSSFRLSVALIIPLETGWLYESHAGELVSCYVTDAA